MRLWAKIILDTRVKRDILVVLDEFNQEKLEYYLTRICYELAIETPIVLSKHRNNLENFNAVKFFPDDFVDKVDFDYLLLEKYDE